MKEQTEKAAIFGASTIHDVEFIKKIQDNYYTIACDGGYLHFLKVEVEPDLLVGDFDTLDQSLIKHPGILYKLNPVKDDTDVSWAIKNLISKGYKEIHLFGCLGQKTDHTYGNIQLLSYLKDKKIKAYLYTPDNENVIFMLDNEEIHFKKNSQGRLSVFSYTPVSKGVTEKYLKYTLNNAELNYSEPLGVSNEFIPHAPKEPYIQVKEGRLLIVAPRISLPGQDE